MSSKTDKYQQMRTIRDEVVDLKTSPLYKERIRNKAYPVIGEGDHSADIMFIGEAPGKNEAATGRPFCGTAGRILDEMLRSVSIDRSAVYITNIVKDRPPANRDPAPDEIELYAPFLDRQIEIIQPSLIATLGRFSMKYILERYGAELIIPTISEAHGRPYSTETEYGQLMIFPLYHPAAAIYNSNLKTLLLNDMKKLRDLFDQVVIK